MADGSTRQPELPPHHEEAEVREEKSRHSQEE